MRTPHKSILMGRRIHMPIFEYICKECHHQFEALVYGKEKAECPKCHNGEAFWVMRQTRAADEPTTRIYRCVKCSHTWREY